MYIIILAIVQVLRSTTRIVINAASGYSVFMKMHFKCNTNGLFLCALCFYVSMFLCALRVFASYQTLCRKLFMFDTLLALGCTRFCYFRTR